MIKFGQIVLKGVSRVQNNKTRSMALKGVSWVDNTKTGHMVFEGGNWVHSNKIRSNGLKRNQLGPE